MMQRATTPRVDLAGLHSLELSPMKRQPQTRIKIAGRCLATLLLTGVLLLRGLVPVGFMPDLAAIVDGTFQIVICTGGGLKVVTVPLAPAHGGEHEPASAGEQCAFAGLVSTVLLAPAQPAILAPVTAASSLRILVVDSGHLGAIVPGLGARAPPLAA